MDESIKHALSFDIEDWFHLVGVSSVSDTSKWDNYSSIVEEKTELILNILDEYGVHGTFFMLGWIARKYPGLSRKIADKGHEIATHSFWHRKVYELTPEEFYEDLKLSVDVLEDQTGKKVEGFRAPSFSIIPGTEWAFDVMKELGLTYDASLFPAKRGHGGYMVKQEPHILENEISDSGLMELPMSVLKMGPFKLPFSGGGYLRFLPQQLIKYGFKSFEMKNMPGIVYLHPRDFAPDCPRAPMPLHRRFKCYVGLNSTERKLRMLLNNFEFSSCKKILKNLLK